jgi:E3 ubiquitin-protein ligase NEDD4
MHELLNFYLFYFYYYYFYSDDWAKSTDYKGYEADDEVIQWFWKCVRSWTPERKSRLLQFATGTSRVPVSGFEGLQGTDGPKRFTIERSDDSSQLPMSHMCFNKIDLPPYEDYASLEQKLTLAVEYVVRLEICVFFFWLSAYFI